jgi:hypothetical protein
MNCREFEDVVNDIARPRLMDGSSRALGLEHARACARCAARLADERALSAGLKSLAASDEETVAPKSLESALLNAFRSQTSETVQPNVGPVRLRPRGRPQMAWAALAAAALIVFGLIAYRLTRGPAIQDSAIQDSAIQRPAPTSTQVESVGKIERSPTPTSGGEDSALISRPDFTVSSWGVNRVISRRHSSPSRLGRPFIRDGVTAYSSDSEYLTDFFLLNYDADQRPMESGELIRVQMPRSALVKFGLPVNVEHADVPVKADLLVGEDGLARAIRFVQ